MRKRDLWEELCLYIAGLAFRIIAAALIVMLLLKGISWGYSLGHRLFYDHPMSMAPGTETEITIRKNDNSEDIAKTLEKAGLIDNADTFRVLSKLYEGEYSPGKYTLSTDMKISEIIEKLTDEGHKNEELEEKNLVASEGNG